MYKKFPYIQQLDSQDCGFACLRIISKFYGKSILSNNSVSIKVENIILNLYYEKFQEIQNYALYDICNKNIGFVVGEPLIVKS